MQRKNVFKEKNEGTYIDYFSPIKRDYLLKNSIKMWHTAPLNVKETEIKLFLKMLKSYFSAGYFDIFMFWTSFFCINEFPLNECNI